MTASPLRPRSQNTATSPDAERGTPSQGYSRADYSHLRTLPPTLFRLPNLNVSKPVNVPSGSIKSVTNTSQTSYVQAPEAADSSTAKAELPSQKETIAATGEASSARSFVSRLSSQSIVLFLILAIAIMGIVIGNRGGEQMADTENPLKEGLPAEQVATEEKSSATPKSGDTAVADELAMKAQQAGQSNSESTKHADLAVKSTSQATSPNAVVDPQQQAAAADDVEIDQLGLDGPAQSSVASRKLPTDVSQEEAPADATGQDSDLSSSTAKLGIPASSLSPAAERTEPKFAASNAVVSQSPATANKIMSGYVQTQTPAGINDWLLYLPSVTSEEEAPGTLAVSATPKSPIASYQQYLNSMSPTESQTTAPVGYLQDSYSGYQNNTVGTQAQLPISTSSTQRR